MATTGNDAVRVSRRIPLQYECWHAFKERDYHEAIRLLSLVKTPKKIDLMEYSLRVWRGVWTLLLVEFGV